mgnify:CR=1 FL=1
MPLVVLVVISFVCTSKLPPSCGVVSLTTSVPTVANSIALPAEFTLSVLPAALPKLDGVSDNPVNVELPPEPPPPPSSAIINADEEESYFSILPSATPDVFTSDKAFKEPKLPSLVFSASVKALVLDSASYADFISAPV